MFMGVVQILPPRQKNQLVINQRDVAQPGSAHAWGAWGRRFKSCHPDKFYFFYIILIQPSSASR